MINNLIIAVYVAIGISGAIKAIGCGIPKNEKQFLYTMGYIGGLVLAMILWPLAVIWTIYDKRKNQ